MTADANGLHLVDIPIRTRSLWEIGRRLHLPGRHGDAGYLVHCVLKEAFGDDAPGPFGVVGEARGITRVLAYSRRPAADLKEDAGTYSAPDVHGAVDWTALASKPMPAEWPAGRSLGFRLRACPVRRMSGEDERHRRGAEVDAFLARCWEVGADVVVDRSAIYEDWLGEQLKRCGGAKLVRCRMVSFRRVRLVRRTQSSQRKAALPERPDVEFTGLFEVTDGARFSELLRRGIGRHRSFGFGMVLLRRPIAADAGEARI